MTKYDLDLDALMPESKTIKLGGKAVIVKPPTTKELMSLLKLGKKLEKMETGEDAKPEEMAQSIDDLKDSLADLIPAVKEIDLNIEQITKLTQFIVEMAVPKELEEVEKTGVTIDSPKDKAE